MRSLVPLLFALTACSSVPGPNVAPEQDVQLLAALFADARSLESHLARDFACVSMRQGGTDVDPSAAVVEELESRWGVPVVPGSRCTVGGRGDVVVAPGITGHGKWLRIANLECRTADQCTADVSYYVANLGAGGRSVTIERTRSGWRITPSGSMWIS